MTATSAFASSALPAAFDSIRPATASLLETAQSWGVPAASGTLFEVAIGEVMINAVKHGGQRADGEIRWELELGSGTLLVRVFDAGRGFDPSRVPEPAPRRERPERLAESGYGLAIVQSVFDRLEPIWRGNTFGVELTLDLQSPASES